MSAIFICVIVLDKMCLHMLSLCWFKHKNIFECFSCFWKVFCFYKNWKFKKQCCPILATQLRVRQVVCHSRDLAAQFWWLVRKWKVQSWGVQREFRGSAHNSLASRHSSRKKHLENFSQFCLWVFSRLDLATCWRLTSVVKIACLAKTGSVFPRTFCDWMVYPWGSREPSHENLYVPLAIGPFTHEQVTKINTQVHGWISRLGWPTTEDRKSVV